VEIVTDEQIEAGKSPRGGFSRKTLASWGVPWPPPRRWRTALRTGKPMPNQRKPSRQMEIWREIRRADEDMRMQIEQEIDTDDDQILEAGARVRAASNAKRGV
jgi:hypothetical protein